MILVSGEGVTEEADTPTPAQIEATYLVTLLGTDGTLWDLNNGPVQLMSGVKLFDIPPLTQWLNRSPGIAGARRTGMQVEEQSLILPVFVSGTAWDTYRDLEQAFSVGLDPDQPVTITVTSPDAIVKSIDAWLTGTGDNTDDTDPLLFARRTYQLGFVAPSAYWQAPPIRPREISLQPPVPWLDPPGPPFYLNPPNNSQNATIDNPGDVPTWARISIDGPVTGFTVSIGEALFSSASPMDVGEQLVIDGASRSILNQDGDRVFDQLDQVVFKPIPVGLNIPIGIDVTGYGPTSRVQVEATPLYRRPM